MKIVLTFKTPNVMDIIEQECEPDADGYPTEEHKEMVFFVEKYVEYGEYIRVEFDSKTKTVKVLER